MSYLEIERKKTSFDPEKLGHLFFSTHGISWFDRFRKIQDAISNDPVLKFKPEDFGKARKQLYEESVQKAARFHELIGIADPVLIDISHLITNQVPGSVHNIMFVPTIANLGNDKQVKRWLDDAKSLRIFGCYAQTELGHGSDVQSLETTATFDSATDEFVINSPTISSTKWWPGELGISANYAAVYAQAYINGKHYGVQAFVVPIRDIQTHETLPGITVGDIGPKLGYHTKDNGYLRFSSVRIPRENMLMRYTKVSKTGEVSKPGNERIGYATMMYVRVKLLESAQYNLTSGLTIAVRYSAFRKQFKDSAGNERVILDYQLQQNKLLPIIANTYAMNATSKKIRALYTEMMRKIKEYEDFSMMNDLHALLAGCKAFFTWDCHNGLDVLRQACGGHGYSAYSGIISLLNDFAPNVTLEGDNNVMALQTARYLIKSIDKATKGGKLMESVEYLKGFREVVAVQRCAATSKNEFESLEYLEKVMQANGSILIWAAAQKFMKIAQEGVHMKDVWDQKVGIQLVEATRAHIHYFTYKCFMEMVTNDVKDEKIKDVLTKLCLLFGMQKLLDFPLGLAQGGYFLPQHFIMLKEMKEDLLETLRPQAIGLVDAFGVSEGCLNSALGRADGKIYETLYEWASTKNPLTTGKPNEAFLKYLKPVMGRVPTPKL